MLPEFLGGILIRLFSKCLLVITQIALSSCSELQDKEDPRNIKGIAPDFMEFVQLYEYYKKGSIGDIPIGFVNMQPPYVGKCVTYSNGLKEIEIDVVYWNKPDTTRDVKLGLLFHELGHCDLNRPHYDGNEWFITKEGLSVFAPKSLMFKYNFYTSYFSMMELYYIRELFNPNTTKEL